MPDAPKLLSGGNPQIPKGDGPAPVQAYLDAMPEWKQRIGVEIDEVVVRLIPDVRKAVRWNTPFYGVEGQGWFLSFHCFTKYVKVGFLNGDHLDPLPPLDAKGSEARYVHFFEGDEIATPEFEEWVRQSAALPGEELF
jgi:hypothetical protein